MTCRSGSAVDLVLFDLDDTLVSTAALRTARHSRTALQLRSLPEYASVDLFPGVTGALAELASTRRVGLVTSAPAWYVGQLLDEHLPAVRFTVTVTYDDVTALKPDPEPLLAALSRTRTAAARAVYVGDDLVDQQAARAAGVRFVGAGWTARPGFVRPATSAVTPFAVFSILARS